jgi:hypothetical protein
MKTYLSLILALILHSQARADDICQPRVREDVASPMAQSIFLTTGGFGAGAYSSFHALRASSFNGMRSATVMGQHVTTFLGAVYLGVSSWFVGSNNAWCRYQRSGDGYTTEVVSGVDPADFVFVVVPSAVFFYAAGTLRAISEAAFLEDLPDLLMQNFWLQGASAMIAAIGSSIYDYFFPTMTCECR